MEKPMTEITLKYNPFEAKASYEYKGKNKTMPKCMGSGENSRLQDWLYDFFPELKSETMHNWGDGSECALSFHGTPGDFEDIEHARDVFQNDNPGIKITLNHLNTESKSLGTRLSDLNALFEKMQKESPYAELADPSLRPRFKQALSYEFEISVIATMSSGKSTLINAILGQEILPARNEATTAKIAQIHDDDNAKGFTVRGLKKDVDGSYKPVTEETAATLEELEKLNSSDDINKIEITGNIPGINSREMRLLLSDTPGPNNSQSIDHAKHIDDLIKADYKPMIMYILNATQLEINDDKSLLEKISTAMDGSGKQGADRFLFVLNKADEIDPDKEFIGKKVSDCKGYLEKNFSITGARIFPVSAQLAKLIRMSQAGRKLTEDEGDFLEKKKPRFINRKERHFSDYVSLSPSCKKRQEEILQNAKAANDENTQALVYSGIYAIELAMNEYLEKYALTAKISKAVGVFISIINRLDLKNKTEKELAKNHEKKEETIKQLKTAQSILKKGERAKELKAQFQNDISDIKKQLDVSFEGYETKINIFSGKQENIFKSKELEPSEARNLIKGVLQAIKLEYKILHSDLERLLKENLLSQAKSYLDEYREYIKGLMRDDKGYIIRDAFNLLQIAIPDNPEKLVKEFSETKTWSTKEKDTDFWGGAKRFLGEIFKKEDWGYHTERHEKTTVNMDKLFIEHILPIQSEFFNTIKYAKKEAGKETQGLLEYFESHINELDDLIKGKMSEQEKLLEDQGKLEDAIRLNQSKMDWLEYFKSELYKVLEV
jgi:GTPase Era involved in 16S rRNA processing